MGRYKPKRRRACLYVIIQAMITAEPHGYTLVQPGWRVAS